MKKSILLPLLLLASLGFAQHNALNTAGKNLPPIDPTILQGMPADTEAPVVTCLNGLSVNIMPTGMIQLWASDFLLSVSDNVTPVDQIKIGIRKAGTGTGFPVDGAGNPIAIVTFDCNELGTKDIELWAMDDSGNAAFCITTIILQDNLGNCPGNNSININLCARVLCSGVAIETAIFELDGSVNFAPPFSYFDLSDASGCSDFTNNVPVASTFTIKPIKDDNPLNGMDEQDFVLLSKHINSTQPFTEPWQWVAADANRDGQITLADSIEFRNLALGIYTELPDNHSWRFVPEGYQFPVPDPLAQPLPESVTIAEALTNMDTIFVGIKIGDLDCSAIPNFSGNPGGGYNQPTADKNQVPIDPTILQGLPADTEAPEVTCLNGLIVNIMPTGTIQLWASDFLQSVSDNVTPVDQIKIGIRKAGTGTGFPVDGAGNPIAIVTFDCNELGTKDIELWAMDDSGNAAFCITTIILQDNLGNCPGNNSININLCARVLCSGVAIETAIFELDGSVNFAPPFSYFDLSDASGCSDFTNNVPVASTFTIKPIKDDNPLNGMDEQDFVLLSKHINSTQPFTEPWQWVAADANRDGQITLADSIEFRNLALGIYTELPDNHSWRFVPEGYQFPVPDPLAQPLPESVTIAEALTNMDTIFVGIKIGDLDCSAIPNFSGNPGGGYNQPTADKNQVPIDPTILQGLPADTEAPEVTCLNGLIVNIMPTGTIQLWASDFLQSVSDNVTPVDQIKIGIRKAGTGTGFPVDGNGNPIINVTFSCNELELRPIELWAIDEAGNADYCETSALIQDGFSVCDQT